LKEIRNTLREKRAQLAVAEEALKEIKREINENEEKLRQLKNSNSSLEDRMTSLEVTVCVLSELCFIGLFSGSNSGGNDTAEGNRD
jgi:predicted nuclease with TOPRIM domain